MTRPSRCWLPSLLLALALAAPSAAQESNGAPQAAQPAPDTAQLKALVAQLGHPDYSQREAATQELIRHREAALPALREGLASADPEVRLRCMYIIRRQEVLMEKLLSTALSKALLPAAEDAVKKIREDPEGFREVILLKAQQHARNRADINDCYRLNLCIDLLREVARPEDAQRLTALLLLNLEDAHGVATPLYMLIEVLAKLPREVVIEECFKVYESPGAERNAFPRVQAAAAIAALGRPQDYPRLVKLALGRSPQIRAAAARAARRLATTDESAKALLPLLNDEDEEVALAAIQAAEELRLEAAAPILGKVIERDSERLREAAIRAMGTIGVVTVPETIRLFLWPKVLGTPAERKDRLREQAGLRGRAAWALARMKKASAAELIALIEADEGIEWAATNALAVLGDREGIAYLCDRAKDLSKPQVAIDACKALGLVKDSPEASQALYDTIRGPDQSVAMVAVLALRDQNTPVSRQKLVELVRDPAPPNILGEVYTALARLDVQESIPLLLKHLQSGDPARSGSIYDLLESLGILGGKDVIAALRAKYKETSDGPMGQRIAWALARAGYREHMDGVINESVQTMERNVRQGMVPSLNTLGIDLLYAHEWDRAELAFRRMMWTSPNMQFATYNIACIYGMQGKEDEGKRADAIRLLHRCVEKDMRYWRGNWRHFATDPDLASLRGDPRYERLIDRCRIEEIFSRQG